MSRPLCVDAWCLAEGDMLPGGAKIVSVHRDPAANRVLVGTTMAASESSTDRTG